MTTVDTSRLEMLWLPARYYQMWPPNSPGGLMHDLLELPVAQTCFIALHCWSSGYSDGPALPVDRCSVNTGVPQGVEGGADELRREIIDNRIRPAIAVARSIGMPIIHVESRRVGSRYPQSQYMIEPEEDVAYALQEAIPGWKTEQMRQVATDADLQWEGWPDLDIAPTVRPLPEDHVVITGAQFDRILRQLGIVNLIYTGFHVGTCVTNSPGATREMSLQYGYRTILLRECTLNLEFPDTLANLEMTRAALRYTEQHVGYTARLDDFLAQCRMVKQAKLSRSHQSFPHEVSYVYADVSQSTS